MNNDFLLDMLLVSILILLVFVYAWRKTIDTWGDRVKEYRSAQLLLGGAVLLFIGTLVVFATTGDYHADVMSMARVFAYGAAIWLTVLLAVLGMESMYVSLKPGDLMGDDGSKAPARRRHAQRKPAQVSSADTMMHGDGSDAETKKEGRS